VNLGKVFCSVWACHSGNRAEIYLQAYNLVYSDGSQLTFRQQKQLILYCFLGLLFDPEDRGDIFSLSIGWLSVTTQRYIHEDNICCYVLFCIVGKCKRKICTLNALQMMMNQGKVLWRTASQIAGIDRALSWCTCWYFRGVYTLELKKGDERCKHNIFRMPTYSNIYVVIAPIKGKGKIGPVRNYLSSTLWRRMGEW
jgi:hypothetical protein